MSSDFVAPDKLEPTTIPILVGKRRLFLEVNTCFEEFRQKMMSEMQVDETDT
jgi:hypothetical protein